MKPWLLRYWCSTLPAELTSQLGACYYVSSSETRELFLKFASEAWFPAIFLSAISKIKHSSHQYRYLVQRLMNKTVGRQSVDDIDQFFKLISCLRIRIVITKMYETDVFKAIILSNNKITLEVSMNCH